MEFLRNRLGRRIVTLMVLASAVLSVFSAAGQLYLSYRSDITRLESEFEVIETSFLSGLENALWEFNFDQVEVLLEGIIAQQDVVAVRLIATTGQSFERGDVSIENSVERQFNLVHSTVAGQDAAVGQLTVAASLSGIQARLWSQFLTLVVSNFLKTLAASLVMLVIFERLVSRHLRKIAEHVSLVDWDARGDNLRLENEPNRHSDEIRDIVSALNESRLRLHSSRQQTEDLRQRMEVVFNAATSGIVGFDRTGGIATINLQAQHMLGVLEPRLPCDWPTQIRFLNPEDMSPLEASADPIQRVLAGQVLKNETALMSRGAEHKEPRYVRIASAALPSDDTSEIQSVVVIDDVSEQERNRQQVERASRLDALGQLTGGVAHDFNNLLSAILYNMQLALTAKTAGDRNRYIKSGMASVDRGATLTRRLLAFAKRQPGIAKSQSVSSIFEEFETLVRPTIEEAIELQIESVGADLNVFCDIAQLENALLNLVINARDAIMREGKGSKILIKAREVSEIGHDKVLKQEQKHSLVASGVRSSADEGGKTQPYIEISVSDDGPGMAEEVRRRALDPFFTTKNTNSGTGLGLSMVYGFIQQSDGHLRIYSDLSYGTTIRLLLPRGQSNEDEDRVVLHDPEVKGSGQVVLVVEDEPDLAALVGEVIEELGYRVVRAKNGKEAIHILGSEQVLDCMLTDVVMPGGISGFELAARARALRPDLPIIYTSGYTGFSEDQMGEVVAPILAKPATPDELGAALALANRIAGPTRETPPQE